MLTLVILAILLVCLYHYGTSTYGYWQRMRVPFIPPTPLIGNFLPMLTVSTGLGPLMADLYNRMSQHRYFGIWVFRMPHLVIRDPELIKAILVKDFDHFTDRTLFSDTTIDPIASHLLFLGKFPEWRDSRKRITAAFSSGKIKAMVPLVNNCADDMKAYLRDLIAQSGSEGGVSIDAKQMITKFTTDVIAICAFGLDGNCYKNDKSPLLRASTEMFQADIENTVRTTSYFLLHGVVKFFRMRFAKIYVYDVLRDMFLTTMDHRKKSNIQRNDLVDILMQNHKEDISTGVDKEMIQVLSHAVQFFVAGTETMATTISFALYELCLNQDIQDKLRAEINSAIEKFGGVTYEAIQSMEYLDLCVNETLRMFPVLPFLDRRCTKDYTLPGTDITIKKGIPVYIPMIGLHYDSKYYPNPEVFDPNRYTEENSRGRHPFSFIPFGHGPHNCIGERLGVVCTKLGLVQILASFEVHRNDKTPVPIVYDPRGFILQAKGGVPMTFRQVRTRKVEDA